jgi:hypothetical protein
LIRFEQDGLELVIDQASGEVYASQAATARMCGVSESTITRWKGVAQVKVLQAEILTPGGLQGVALIDESGIFAAFAKYNPQLLVQCAKAGIRIYLYGLAGYKVAPEKPKTALQLAKEQVKLLEQLELKELQIKVLAETNERQAEVIDELFDYSSIIRIAKYNGCDEKAFSWQHLKTTSRKIGAEIKKAPCPRFVMKNLYSHDAWRLAYPGYKLPETTTLAIEEQ